MTKTNYIATRLVNAQTGQASYTSPAALFVGVSTTFPAKDGTNVTEPSGGGYARASCSGRFPAASSSGTVAGTTTNNAEVALTESTGAWASGADLVAFLLHDASSAGNLIRYGWLGREADQYFRPADVNATTNRITLTSHGYSSANSVVLMPVGASTLPAGITANTRYYLSSIDANTIELHTNVGLSSIVDITGTGTGAFAIFRFTPRQVTAAGVTLRFPTSSLTITED